MPLFTKHRNILYTPTGETITPNTHTLGDKIQGLSNKTGKPNRQPLTYQITQAPDGSKRFTLKGLLK